MMAPFKSKNEQGVVLILGLLYSFLIITFLSSFFVILTGGLRQANKATESMRAYYVADAGLANAFMQLRASSSFPASFNVPATSYPVGPDGFNGSYTVSITTDEAVWPTYTLISQGTFGNTTKTLTLRVKATSFAKWNYLSNSEISPTWGTLWWVTGMLSDGPVHTNGQLNIAGSPIFQGPTSQTSSSIHYYNGGPPTDNPDFQAGLTLNTSPIYFPTTELLNSIKGGAQQAQGISLTGNTTVTLVSDGTMKVTNSAKSWNNKSMAIPANGALYVQDGDVTVAGTLKGRLTIGSNKTVWIGNNIRYSSDPRTNPSSTDTLGLVASTNVTIKQTAPDNLEIDAYIVAITGSFQLENFATGGYKGDMVQFGGLMNNTCGPTGVMDSHGNIIDGYNQLQYYDRRLQDAAPPWFTPARDSANGRILYYKIDLKES
jgi:hypothetical protein